MSIELTKNKSRFSVLSCYSDELVKLIKTYNGRFWDAKNRQWTLPLVDYDGFVQKLSNEKLIFSENKEPDVVTVTTNGNNLDVKFNVFIEEFDLFRTIRNSKYNREKQLLQIPLSEKTSLLNVLRKSDIKFNFNEQKQKSNKTTTYKQLDKETTNRTTVRQLLKKRNLDFDNENNENFEQSKAQTVRQLLKKRKLDIDNEENDNDEQSKENDLKLKQIVTKRQDFDIELSTEKNLKERPNFSQCVKDSTEDVRRKLQYENDMILNDKEDWCINYSEITPDASPESVMIHGKKKFLKYMNVSPIKNDVTIEYENQ